jgi:uncharacterized protein
MRFLILAIALLLLWLVLRSLLRGSHTSDRTDNNNRQIPEEMVACAQCRLYLPKSEALEQHGQFFCSSQHRTDWLKKQSPPN